MIPGSVRAVKFVATAETPGAGASPPREETKTATVAATRMKAPNPSTSASMGTSTIMRPPRVAGVRESLPSSPFRRNLSAGLDRGSGGCGTGGGLAGGGAGAFSTGLGDGEGGASGLSTEGGLGPASGSRLASGRGGADLASSSRDGISRSSGSGMAGSRAGAGGGAGALGAGGSGAAGAGAGRSKGASRAIANAGAGGGGSARGGGDADNAGRLGTSSAAGPGAGGSPWEAPPAPPGGRCLRATKSQWQDLQRVSSSWTSAAQLGQREIIAGSKDPPLFYHTGRR